MLVMNLTLKNQEKKNLAYERICENISRGGVFRTSRFPAYRFVCHACKRETQRSLNGLSRHMFFRYTLKHFKPRNREKADLIYHKRNVIGIFRNLPTKVTKYNNKGIRSCTLLADFKVFAR